MPVAEIVSDTYNGIWCIRFDKIRRPKFVAFLTFLNKIDHYWAIIVLWEIIIEIIYSNYSEKEW